MKTWDNSEKAHQMSEPQLKLMLETMQADSFYIATACFESSTGSYAYKVPNDLKLEIGDEVLVVTPSNGAQVVEVIGFKSYAEEEYSKPLKWVVGKVDLSKYTELLEREEKALQVVKKRQAVKAVESVSDYLGTDLFAEVKKTLSE